MPEATFLCPRIRVKSQSNLLGSSLVPRLLCLLIQEEQEITGKHAVQIIKRYRSHFPVSADICDVTITVYVRINPIFYVLQILVFASPLPNEVLAVQVKWFCITPSAEILSSGIAI